MGKVTLLFAGKSYDTDAPSVRENQIVIFDGPYIMCSRMVVAGIEHTSSGYSYRLIDTETAEEHTADLIRPLRDKFGIGHYYDDEHPEFMDAAQVAALRTRADALKHHALRNAIIPVIAFLAVTAAELVAGSIVVEQVFTVPGVGRLLLASIGSRDFPVAQAVVVLLAAWVVVVNFIADVLYQYMDPRIRIQ